MEDDAKATEEANVENSEKIADSDTPKLDPEPEITAVTQSDTATKTNRINKKTIIIVSVVIAIIVLIATTIILSVDSQSDKYATEFKELKSSIDSLPNISCEDKELPSAVVILNSSETKSSFICTGPYFNVDDVQIAWAEQTKDGYGIKFLVRSLGEDGIATIADSFGTDGLNTRLRSSRKIDGIKTHDGVQYSYDGSFITVGNEKAFG